MSRWTSSADPPSSAWMKLACFSETRAVPIRNPFRPAASTSRPAESPGGLAKTEPALLPPGWCWRRHETISASCGPAGVDRSRRQRRTRPRRPPRSARSTTGGSRARAGPDRPRRRRRGQVEPPVPHQAGRGVRSVAAGVHPHRPADRPRHADRPLQPGQARLDRPAGQHRQPGSPARPGPGGRRCRCRSNRGRGERPDRESRRRRPAGSSPCRPPAPARDGRRAPAGRRAGRLRTRPRRTPRPGRRPGRW